MAGETEEERLNGRPWRAPAWSAADVVAAVLGLTGLAVALLRSVEVGAIIGFAGLWLEFTRLYEVRWHGFGRSGDEEDEDILNL